MWIKTPPVTLTATLLDANGQPTQSTSSLEIAFDAVEEASNDELFLLAA
jgi:hypothetical protein